MLRDTRFPVVSVIIPTYNRASYLERAILSVQEQTYQDFDLWVIDDGSTDETEKLVKGLFRGFEHPHRYHYIKISRHGVSYARNQGISLSKGLWTAFLDSDDEWLPSKLSLQMDVYQKNAHLKIIHGEEIWIRRGVRVNPMKKHQKAGGDIFERCLHLCLISPSAVIIHRSLFDQVGFFREDYPVCEDYDLWLRITSLFPVGFVEKPILRKYGGHQDQLSQQYVAMDYWRVKSLFALLEIRPLDQLRREMVINVLRKRCQILLQGYEKHGISQISQNAKEIQGIYQMISAEEQTQEKGGTQVGKSICP